jgi:hypothetical protein
LQGFPQSLRRLQPLRRAPQGEWGGTPWRLVEEARIGAADGSGPDVFGSVVDVTLDPLGRAWVADGQAREIRVFGARGEHVRTIGGRGGGPAEFGAIAGMRWAGDDRLWVLDGGNARFAVYDTAGTLVETRPRTATFVTSPWPGRFDREGRLYDVDGTVAPDGSITTYVVRNASDGASRDTFPLSGDRRPPFAGEALRSLQGFPQSLRRLQPLRRGGGPAGEGSPPPGKAALHPASELAATRAGSLANCARLGPPAIRRRRSQVKPCAVCRAFRSRCGGFSRSGAGAVPSRLGPAPGESRSRQWPVHACAAARRMATISPRRRRWGPG